jgi:hypothetical protein
MLGLQEMITIDDMERRSINTKNICNVRFACKASREYSGRLPSPLTSSNSFSRAMSSFQMWVPDGHSATSCRHEPYAQYAMHPILETTSSSTSMSMLIIIAAALHTSRRLLLEQLAAETTCDEVSIVFARSFRMSSVSVPAWSVVERAVSFI